MGYDLTAKLPEAFNPRDFNHRDDFVTTAPSFWTAVASDLGGVVIGTGTLETGAAVVSPSDGTVADNDETYMYGLKIANLRSGAGFGIAFCFQHTEANGTAANLIFGLSKTLPAANFLGDDGAGLSTNANYDGFYFEKRDGESVWRANSQWSGATGGAWASSDKSRQSNVVAGRQVCIIEVTCQGLLCKATYRTMMCVNGSNGEVLTYADVKASLIHVNTISHDFEFSGSTALLPVFGAKNGSANHEVLTVDFVEWFAIRT